MLLELENSIKLLNSEVILSISNYPDPTTRVRLKIFATKKLIDHFLSRLRNCTAQQLLMQKLKNAIKSATKYIAKSQCHLEKFRFNRYSRTCNYCKKEKYGK